MKKIFVIALFIIIVNSFWSCEKDDICAEGTPTTPSLIIEFYDKYNTTVLKNLTAFKAIEINSDEPVLYGNTRSTMANGNRISIPLRTDKESTTYRFILNSTSENDLNEDVITFNYLTRRVYVSRACGFKSLFDLKPGEQEMANPELIPGEDGAWISDIIVEKTNIEDENETHIKIYF